MTKTNTTSHADAARRAAAEAARIAAEAARRAAAAKATQTAKAGNKEVNASKPIRSRFGADEMSTGKTSALRRTALLSTGASIPGRVQAAQLVTNDVPQVSKAGHLLSTPMAAPAKAAALGIGIPNPIDIIQDVVSGGWDALKDGASALKDGILTVGKIPLNIAEEGIELVEDLGENVLHVVKDGVEFALDTVNGTIDFIDKSADAVKAVVEYAADKGLELAADARNYLRNKTLDAATNALGVDEKDIAKLGPGDSISFGATVDVTAKVSIGADAGLSVTRNDDGTYTVAGNVSADVGAAMGADAEFGVGARIELSAKTPQEAEAMVKQLAAMAVSASNPVLLAVFAPTKSELQDMAKHISAVELSATAAASVDESFPPLELDASLKAESTFRIEFENGKPATAVRTTSVSVEGGASMDFLGDQLGAKAGAEASGTIAVETRMPIKGNSVTDIFAFVASPATAALVPDQATTSITMSGEFSSTVSGSAGGGSVTAGVSTNQGVSGEIKISGIEDNEIISLMRNLVSDPRQALRGVDVELSASVNGFTESTAELGVDIKKLGQGFEAKLDRKRRDVGTPREIEVSV
jgi:hypothetical protein